MHHIQQIKYIPNIALVTGEMPIALNSRVMRLIKGTEAGAESPNTGSKSDYR